MISIFCRASGELMWDAVLADPDRTDEHGRRLVALQELFGSLVPPIALPNQVDRIGSKIRIAARYANEALAAVTGEVPSVDELLTNHVLRNP